MRRPIKFNKLPVLIDNDFIDEDYVWINDNSCLKESDFYPPSDDRVWTSNVEDIDGGDNFVDYCKYIFDILDEEEYWEN